MCNYCDENSYECEVFRGDNGHYLDVETSEWDDESPLNYTDCDLADCEKYFKRKVPLDNDRNVFAGQTYRNFKGHTVKVFTYQPGYRSTGAILRGL